MSLPAGLLVSQPEQRQWLGCGFDHFSLPLVLGGSRKLGNQGSFVEATFLVGALQSPQSEISRWSEYLTSIGAPTTEDFDLRPLGFVSGHCFNKFQGQGLISGNLHFLISLSSHHSHSPSFTAHFKIHFSFTHQLKISLSQ